MKRIKGFISGIILSTVCVFYSGCDVASTSFDETISLLSVAGSSSSYVKALLKINPVSVTPVAAPEATIKSSASTAEVSTVHDDLSLIWNLFDANTGSAYMATRTYRFAVSFGGPINLKRIRLYGNTSYIINVYSGPADELTLIPQLCVNKSALNDSWNSLPSDEIIRTDSLTLEIIPEGDAGIQELEFWSEGRVAMCDGGITSNLDGIKSVGELESAVQTQNHIVQAATATPDEASIASSPDGSGIAQFHLMLGVNPAMVKRAYIAYRAKNIPAPVCIERRINNLSWRGGYEVPAGSSASSDWIVLFEEINPAWLVTGDNLVEFRTTKSDVSIQHLKLVLVQDNGWNQVTASSLSDAYDDDLKTTSEMAYNSDVLDLHFDRKIEPESIMINISQRINGKASVQYLSNNLWQAVKSGWTADLSTMEPGWNTITLPAPVSTTAIRLQFSPNFTIGDKDRVRINEVRVCGSPVGDPSTQPRIIVGYPRNGEYFSRTAYIQGFVASRVPAQISVEGSYCAQPVQDNSFSIALIKDYTRFSAQKDDEAWAPVASATGAGYSVSLAVMLTNNMTSSSSGAITGSGSGTSPVSGPGSVTEGYTAEVYPDGAKTITYGPITIEIPAGAVDEKISITIIPLTKDQIAALNPGMVNVTFPSAGYRFLVNGKPHYSFKKPIRISFTYSRSLLLNGQVDNDVFMFYYDESGKTWRRLNRVSGTSPDQTVSQSASGTMSIVASSTGGQKTTGLGMVTSETDHFTDIIDATITVPEQPDPLMYNPNTIKDIKVGDPSEGVNLIDPPSANSTGEVRLSYPIEVPPGRKGMHPRVAVIYTSSHNNGWLGVGWDIPMRAISIDTKFGVPRYNRTEKYILEGEPIELASDGYYHTRVEGAFRRIRRNGTECNNFTWEVTDKDGTKYYYGTDDNSRLRSYRTPGNIFMWCLRRIEDTSGNSIIFNYFTDDYTPADGGETSRQIYLDRITYTGRYETPGAYSVIFNREPAEREDKIVNCRGGFKTLTRYRLKTIDVMYGSNRVRQYGFDYKPYNEALFHKSLLEDLYQCSAGGCFNDDGSVNEPNVFNKHSFAYYEDIKSGANNDQISLFGENIDVDNEHVERNSPYYFNDASGKTSSWDIIIFGPYPKDPLTGRVEKGSPSDPSWEKVNNLFIIGTGRGDFSSNNKIELIDINGDGLVDQVYLDKDDDKIYYRENLGPGEYDSEIVFSDISREIPSLTQKVSHLSLETSSNTVRRNSFGFRPSASSMMTAAGSGSTGGISYFMDVNGDGLADFVNNRLVLYNSIIDGEPVFSEARPDGFGSDSDADHLTGPTPPTEEELRNTNYRDDPILMWEAPYHGIVRITGDVTLLPKEQLKGSTLSNTEDGVRVSIQTGTNILWTADIRPDDALPVSPMGVDAISVYPGDRIFFRVNSIDDGWFDCVEWNPVIEYTDKGESSSLVDENLLPQFRYEAKRDFSFAGDQVASPSLVGGRVNIEGFLYKKGSTSDDITVELFKLDAEDIRTDILSYTIPADETGRFDMGLPIDCDIASADKLYCYVSSDTPIDWTQVYIAPIGIYTEITGYESAVDAEGNPIMTVNIPVNIMTYPVHDSEPHYPLVVPEDKAGKARIVYTIEPLSPFPPMMPEGYKANITIAIKKDGKTILKEKVEIRDGMVNPVIIDEELDVSAGDTLYFVCSYDMPDVADYMQIGVPTIYYEVDNGRDDDGSIGDDIGVEVDAAVYRMREDNHPFAGGYRSWFFSRWNGENEILDPAQMIIPDMSALEDLAPEDYDEVSNLIKEKLKTFSPMNSMISDYSADELKDKVWFGHDINCFIGSVHVPGRYSDFPYYFYTTNPDDYRFVMSSSRVGYKNIASLLSIAGGDYRGAIKYTESSESNAESNCDIDADGENEHVYSSIDIDGDGVAERISNNSVSNTKTDYFDFNGDGFPEIVDTGGFYCTNPDGSIDNTQVLLGLQTLRKSSSISTAEVSEGNTYTENGSGNMSISDPFNGKGRTNLEQSFIDMNGDSLPDVVFKERNEDDSTWVIKVRYNLGYSLGDEEELDASREDIMKIFSRGMGAAGADPNCLHWGTAGATWGSFTSQSYGGTQCEYKDVNGDGLPDMLEESVDGKLTVRINTGSGFTEESYPAGDLFYYGSSGYHIEVTYNVSQGLSVGALNHWYYGFWHIGLMAVWGSSTTESQSIAGLIDINGDGIVDQIKATNGGFETVRLNQSGKMNLLKNVSRPLGGSFTIDYKRTENTSDSPRSEWVLDIVTVNDGMSHSYTSEYEYQNGYYDRKEREFCGFETLTETMPDRSTVTHLYYNKDIYRRGLERQNESRSPGGIILNRNISYYNVRDIADTIRFPYIERKESHVYQNDQPASSSQSFVYDRYGNIVSYIDYGGPGNDDDIIATIGYSYNDTSFFGGKPNSIIVEDAYGKDLRKRVCTYNHNGTLASIDQYSEDNTWATTTIDYDGYGNIVSITAPKNHNEESYIRYYGYDAATNSHVTTIRDVWGYTSHIYYDLSLGKPVTKQDINENRIMFAYDPFGRIKVVQGPDDIESGKQTYVVDYDISTVPARAYTQNICHVGTGGTGQTIKIYTYMDGLKRVIQTKKDADVNGAYCMVASGSIAYDEMGRVIRQGQPVQSTPEQAYTASTEKYPTEYTYDDRGRVIDIDYPDGTSSEYSYSLSGNNLYTVITDPEGKTKTTVTDIRGKIISVTEGNNITTRYEYNPIGEITRVIDARSNPTEITYDKMGRRISIENRDTGLIEYRYDKAGNLTSKITPNLRAAGQAINYSYLINQLRYVQYPNMTTVAYTYGLPTDERNSRGRISRIENGNIIETRKYGRWGEMTESTRQVRLTMPEERWSDSYTTRYVYDNMGRMVSLIYPDGEMITYTYDRGGLLKSVGKSETEQYISGILYNELGQRTQVNYGNGAVSIYGYEEETGRLERLNTQLEGKVLQNIEYSYTDAGNIESRHNADFTALDGKTRISHQEYGYDVENKLDRLVSSSGYYRIDGDEVNNYSNTFAYDSIGNMLTKVQTNNKDTGGGMAPVTAMTYTHNYVYGGTRPHAVTSTGSANYGYDLNGNMSMVTDIGFTRVLSWDDENRLTRTIDNGVSTEYRYDAGGKRVVKKTGLGEVAYVNDNYSLRYGDVKTKHIFAGNTRVATKITAPDSPEGTYYYHGDHLGSSSVITTGAKAYHENLEYFPYGETWVREQASANQESMPYKFTGQIQDDETGLYYFGARYYDPKLSRWISVDRALEKYLPLNKSGSNLPAGGIYNSINLNLFNYCANEPTSYIDPDGNVPIVAAAVIVGGTALINGGLNALYVGLNSNWNGSDMRTAFGIGAVAGFMKGLVVVSSIVNPLSVGALNSGISYGESVATQYFTGDGNVSQGRAIFSGLFSGSFSGLTKYASNSFTNMSDLGKFSVNAINQPFIGMGSKALAGTLSDITQIDQFINDYLLEDDPGWVEGESEYITIVDEYEYFIDYTGWLDDESSGDWIYDGDDGTFYGDDWSIYLY